MIMTYLCPDSEAVDVTAQLAIVNTFCATHGLGVPTVFADGSDERGTPWPHRPAGRRLFDRLQEGDRIVLDGRAAFTTLADHWTAIRMILAVGASITFLSPEFTIRPGDEGTVRSALRVLCLFGNVRENDRRTVIRAALRGRKAAG